MYSRHASDDSPAMRGADPAIVLVPGIGVFSYEARTSRPPRVAGEFYLNAINVMRGAESVATYAPISESEKFRIEILGARGAKLRRLPPPKRFADSIALVTGGASGIGRSRRLHPALANEGACVAIADLEGDKAARCRPRTGAPPTLPWVCHVDVTDMTRAVRAVGGRLPPRLRRARPRRQQRGTLDLQAAA